MPGRPGNTNRRRDDRRRDDKGRDSRSWEPSEKQRPRPEGPREPIKGRRRTFDVDSEPNERERARRPSGDDASTSDSRTGEQWVDEGPVRKAAGEAVRRGSSSGRPSGGRGSSDDKRGKRAPSKGGGSGRNAKRKRGRTTNRVQGALEIDRDRLVRMLGQTKANRVVGQLADATEAFAEERLDDARKILKPLAELVPDEPAIRELNGLTLYRLGRWRLAITELTEFARRTDSTDQHPVLADCHRALGQHPTVERLWEELGEASPDAATIAEGRIVYAGSLADQGKVAEAIKVLESGSLGSKTLKDHHLRMRYALGDLYDRAGESQAARRQFEAVVANDPEFFDVRDRLRQL
ncbi:tetratricopeptide repeat protein [Actinospongicola halichondriae]|uniref:tetratricopeptide repeat protein n=1 Tax=Actinospongicola halichondriae TaxID=3236844 RepID=UPI003D491C74